MVNLTNSTTKVLRATQVPLTPTTPVPTSGRAIAKSGFVQRLGLQSGEVDAV
jgi:hypothetical protein